jgi:hypothetical protein
MKDHLAATSYEYNEADARRSEAPAWDSCPESVAIEDLTVFYAHK